MIQHIFSRRSLATTAAALGLTALGVLGTLGYQKYLSHDHETGKVHYHANFRVYLDTQFVDLSGAEYMEELASCAVDPTKEKPEDRVHMHENKGDLIHVHDAGATWGHFMSNIGWNFGDTYVSDSSKTLHVATATKKARYVLNGKFVQGAQNLQIRSVDRFLIDFSDATDEEVLKRFETVPQTADAQNHLPDPASCGGFSE